MAFDTYEERDNKLLKEYTPHEVSVDKYNKGDRVLVIDGDILAYKLASFGDIRQCRVTDTEGNITIRKNRTSFKKEAKELGIDVAGYTYEDFLVPQPIQNCIASLKGAVNNLKRDLLVNKVEIYIGGSDNFRNELELPTTYKGSRTTQLRPTYLTMCKEYLMKYHGAIKIKGVEADDFVQQRMYELYKDNIMAVLYSNDKDARQAYQFPITIYNPDNKLTTLYKDGLGELWLAPNGDVKGCGLKWLIGQTLFGDSTDNYKGNELSEFTYGDKSYYNDVHKIETIEELLNYAVSKWKLWYPKPVNYLLPNGFDCTKSWLELANMYWYCAYMRISVNDKTSFESLLKEYNIEY